MATTPLTDLARRLLVNVDANRGDYAESMMTVPAEEYRDRARFASELEAVYRRSPAAGRLVGRHSRAERLHHDGDRRPADRGDAR